MEVTVRYYSPAGETSNLTVPLSILEPDMVFKDGRHTVMDQTLYHSWEDLTNDLNAKPRDTGVEIKLFMIVAGG